MTDRSFTTVLDVPQPPDVVFDAVNDPRAWWSADITGETDVVGGEFEFEVPGVHYTKFVVAILEPGRRVVWDAIDADIAFVQDRTEWTGTRVLFELTPTDAGTSLRFTHEGLVPEFQCYDACSVAWESYISGSLGRLAATGTGDPNQERGEGRLADIADEARGAAAG